MEDPSYGNSVFSYAISRSIVSLGQWTMFTKERIQVRASASLDLALSNFWPLPNLTVNSREEITASVEQRVYNDIP